METILTYLRRIPAGPVLAVMAVLGIWVMNNAPDAPSRVPALEGLHVDEAQTIASESGYATRLTHREGGGVEGTVVGQRPAAGDLAGRGSVIDLEVTKGAPQVEVPDVTGMPVDEARRSLTEAGFVAGDVTFRNAPEREPNRVLETDPPAGSSVDAGTTVDLIAAA